MCILADSRNGSDKVENALRHTKQAGIFSTVELLSAISEDAHELEFLSFLIDAYMSIELLLSLQWVQPAP